MATLASLTNSGLSRLRLDEILTELENDAKSVYGNNIAIEPSTEDGQMLGVLAKKFSELSQLAQDVYNSLNPTTASGDGLSRTVTYNNITRKAGSRSTATCQVTGTVGINLPVGTIVQHADTLVKFRTTSEVVLNGATPVSVSVESVDVGAFNVDAGKLTRIGSPIYGWDTVTNPSAGTIGTNVETDFELRVRRRQSLAQGAAILDSIVAAVRGVAGVTYASALENNTGSVVNGMLPHSFTIIVQGGSDSDIANAIFRKRSIGSQMNGDVSVGVVDSQGQTQTIKFQRPTTLQIYVDVVMDRDDGNTTSIATVQQLVKDAVVDYLTKNVTAGSTIHSSKLYSPILALGAYNIQSVKIDTIIPPVAASVSLGISQIPSISASNVTVTVT